MTLQNANGSIRTALGKMVRGDLTEASTQLLATLGYRSDLLLDGQTGNVGDFISYFEADNTDTHSERDFRDSTKEVRILFQFTDAEIDATAQRMLFDAGDFNEGNSRSFLFAAVELNGNTYPRGRYVSFTREINKRFYNMPAVVVFRTADGRITLAFVNRRPSKIRDDRQVLGSVSLIREIDSTNPHRAHLDILADLSLSERLKWMDNQGQPLNFDGLLSAWLDALDTEELNRRFYLELKDWFDRAVREARFPTTGSRVLKPEEHVIRLITRMLFVWFVKEKGLVAEDLFVENQIASLLRDYDRADGDSYYRAVLQNLFFATLNTEIDGRDFSSQTNTTHRDFSLYRFASEISNPDALLSLFGKSPFINGGLFDCLDSEESLRDGGFRIEYFSDNVLRKGTQEYGKLSIPNRLFFDDDGLITLFNHYKFTIEENTPAEQEVALDPELLGKVFENLLAAYNPETRESARKQTGSYYTPRAVVDYMVDEALVGSLIQKISPNGEDREWWEERLRYLLDYNDAGDLFPSEEASKVIRAIAELKVLDPAVGSGAFPMGVLHKLTLALRRLDPDNVRWRALQEEIHGDQASDAFRTQDREEQRARILEEINANFERYKGSDYGRKLYLIQNSIYGVDIQPVATQIAKLRFFISLAIEQQPNNNPDENYGIQPLPNLETRFVAADTLMGLDKKARQMSLAEQKRVTELNVQLRENRERHFHAGVRREKLRLRAEDRRLRADLATELENAGMPKSDSGKIASWDPYDQNAHSEWFDASYMFDIHDGFDVVIGNPPYKQVRKGTYPKEVFPYSEGRDKGKQNLYKLFVEQSYNLAKHRGVATLIVQSSLMCDLSSAATRQLLLERTQLRHVIEFPKAAPTREAQVFQSVTQGTCIYQFAKSQPDNQPIMISVDNDVRTISDLRFASITKGAIENLYPSLRCLPRIGVGSVSILEKIAGNSAITPLRDHVASIAQGDLNLSTHSKRYSNKPTKVRLLRGRNVGRFIVKYDTSTEYCDQSFMRERVKVNREGAFLISQEVTGTNDIRRLHFGLTEKLPTDFLCGHTVNKMQLWDQAHSRAFLALLNSKFMDWFFRITSTNNHVQGYELEQLPIPVMTTTDLEQLGKLAARVMREKASNPAADTSDMEEEIDWLVYDLYGLTNEEAAVVEDYF